MNCLGKSAERLFANRLNAVVEHMHLHRNIWLGGRRTKSAIHTALLIYHQVQEEKLANRAVTTVFLDIKGAFDHVAKNQLLSILARLGLPVSLMSWVKSFLSTRLLRLSFDGNTQNFTEIITGIPQGSPISPILFLIYIRNLFCSSSICYLSYIDDIAIMVASTTTIRNIAILERELAKLYTLGNKSGVEFDLDKIELIHWVNIKKQLPSIKLPTGINKTSKSMVKWLGIYFDSKMSFREHIQI